MPKVLVVVDESIILKIINTWLNDKYEITNCRTTDTLDFTGISCAVIQMKSTNWESISQDIAKAGVPFVAVTLDHNDLIAAVRYKCDGHVEVPFTKEELREEVDKCVFKHLGGIVSKNIISNTPVVPSNNLVDIIKKIFQRNT